MNESRGISPSNGEIASLRVFLLGGFRIEHDGPEPEVRSTRAVQALLAFLMLHHDSLHGREELQAIFWPDYHPHQAQRCLSTALWRARAVLEPPHVPRGTYLRTDGLGRIGFVYGDGVWADAVEFQRAVETLVRVPAARLEPPQAASLRHAVDHYKAELLAGFDEEWALRERGRLNLLLLRGLEHLVSYHQERGEPAEAFNLAQRVLERDPLRESVHREVMLCHWRMGQRGLAVQHYRACKKLLLSELGVAPSAETQALFAALSSGVEDDDKPQERSSLRASAALRAELRGTLVTLDVLRRHLEAALDLIGDAETSEARSSAKSNLVAARALLASE
ncbi:MAG TPA: BTAD domain-containing putative transcriptional regulator [Polyangiaceae bacterium]|nr:BTAD domain-containing putative transcriptional regulator [Polyangiaceae bacterium]